MLNDEICKLRERLNDSIINDEDYNITYQISHIKYKKSAVVFVRQPMIFYVHFFICSRRWFESRASDDAIFSFWTSMPSGTTR